MYSIFHISLQTVQLSISRKGIWLAGLEQEQRLTTNRHTAITLWQETEKLPSFKVTGGLGAMRTGPHSHIALGPFKATDSKGP